MGNSEDVDVDYWVALKNNCGVMKARAKVREIHALKLEERLARLEKAQLLDAMQAMASTGKEKVSNNNEEISLEDEDDDDDEDNSNTNDNTTKQRKGKEKDPSSNTFNANEDEDEDENNEMHYSYTSPILRTDYIPPDARELSDELERIAKMRLQFKTEGKRFLLRSAKSKTKPWKKYSPGKMGNSNNSNNNNNNGMGDDDDDEEEEDLFNEEEQK